MKKIFYYKMINTQFPVTIKVNRYAENGNLYVGLDCADEDNVGEPFNTLTENLGIKMPPYCAAIKNYSENEGALEFLLDNEFGKIMGKNIQSQFGNYPIFEFDREKLAALDPDGCKRYENK